MGQHITGLYDRNPTMLTSSSDIALNAERQRGALEFGPP